MAVTYNGHHLLTVTLPIHRHNLQRSLCANFAYAAQMFTVHWNLSRSHRPKHEIVQTVQWSFLHTSDQKFHTVFILYTHNSNCFPAYYNIIICLVLVKPLPRGSATVAYTLWPANELTISCHHSNGHLITLYTFFKFLVFTHVRSYSAILKHTQCFTAELALRQKFPTSSSKPTSSWSRWFFLQQLTISCNFLQKKMKFQC